MEYRKIIEGLERRWQRDMRTAGPQWRRERDRAVIELERAGLTAAEALRLELEDVEENGRVVNVRVRLPAEAAKALRAWLKIREDDPPGPVFITQNFHAVTPSIFSKTLRQVTA